MKPSSEAHFYELLKPYVMTPRQLDEYDFPRPHPTDQSRAVFRGSENNQYSVLNVRAGSELTCSRCSEKFSLTDDGDYVQHEFCFFHSGRIWSKKVGGQAVTYYNCCQGSETSKGCRTENGHVHDGPHPNDLTGFMSTFAKSLPPQGGCPGVRALDCEMCWTSEGVEPVRVTLVNWDQKRIYDTLVRPQGRVLDYKTRFTGLKNGDLMGVDTTLKDVQADLLELISADTLLLGHSLDYDLRALRLIHENVVDTCVVFPHNRGFPYKSALRKIAKIYLHKTIQDGDGGHDSVEDAATCVQLMLWRVGRDLSEDVLDSADDSTRRTVRGRPKTNTC